MEPVVLFRPPSLALQGIVRCHQIIRLRFTAGDPVPPKPYWPRPAIALAFYARAPEQVRALGEARSTTKPRAVLIGQPTSMTMRQGGHDFSVYQIELQPGALYRLTGIPANRITDRYVDAEAVFPIGFRSIVDAIIDANTPDTMIGIAERYLLGVALRERSPASCAIEEITRQLTIGTTNSIDVLAAEAGLSGRQLHRSFMAHVGIGPRMFGRVARFDRTVRLSNRLPQNTWWETAIDSGFFDYQHMVRDFRAFTGLSPAQFREQENEAPERSVGQTEE